MKIVQFDFFRDVDVCELQVDLETLERSHHKVRRRLFAENRELRKLLYELAAGVGYEFKLNDFHIVPGAISLDY